MDPLKGTPARNPLQPLKRTLNPRTQNPKDPLGRLKALQRTPKKGLGLQAGRCNKPFSLHAPQILNKMQTFEGSSSHGIIKRMQPHLLTFTARQQLRMIHYSPLAFSTEELEKSVEFSLFGQGIGQPKSPLAHRTVRDVDDMLSFRHSVSMSFYG